MLYRWQIKTSIQNFRETEFFERSQRKEGETVITLLIGYTKDTTSNACIQFE